MERLLYGKEMAKIDKLYNDAFNLKGNIVYFPVRHHSPACSFHLKKTINNYKPEIILIEGPDNANHLIESLTDEENKTPLSIYYTYSDQEGILGDKKDKYMCYYPFLDYSPEFVAMKMAKELGIPVSFIDLPYEEILLASKDGEGIREKFKKKSYNDDYLIMRSKFIKELCKKQNCRDFNELWEKLYEIDGIHIDTKEFVKNLLTYCDLLRLDYTDEMLEGEGCIKREKYMYMQIKKYGEKYKRILVVTGGFHTSGLLNITDQNIDTEIENAKKEKGKAYVMAYSFEECDGLNGYASGMPYPAFYQSIWENLCKNNENAYEDSVMNFITKCGRELRKQEEGISTADSIEAFHMAKGLALLRDKVQCGAYELVDGVRSSFIKGELSISNNKPLEIVDQLMRGNEIGYLNDTLNTAPIVLDFKETCKRFKIKINTSVKQEKVLSIYKTKSHREISRFFHMMVFLETDFCTRIQGPDYILNKDTNLIREIWSYRWNTRVDSKLIELSAYGGTLREAVSEIILKKMKDIKEHAQEGANLMMHAAIMGLEEIFKGLLIKMKEIIQKDGSFYSLTEACRSLNFIYKENYLMDLSDTEKIKILLKSAYEKSASLISGLYNIPKEDENNTIQMLKELYNISMDQSLHLHDEIYATQLESVINNKECNIALEGAATGLLIGLGCLKQDEGINRAKAYLYGSGEKFLESASFLKGLFNTARDLIIVSESLIDGIDHMIKNISYEKFIEILPEMRLAFSFFIPNEIDEIGKKIGGLYGKSDKAVLNKRALNEEDINLAKELDRLAKEALSDWGLLERM